MTPTFTPFVFDPEDIDDLRILFDEAKAVDHRRNPKYSGYSTT